MNIITSIMGCVCSREDLVVNNNKYSIISKIADGGFGVISLVENTRTYEQFALKRVKCEDRKEIEAMTLENKYYKLLNSHSNLIQLIDDDIREERNSASFTIFSIFPYYQSGTLQDELESNLKKGGFIENSQLMNLFYGICDGTNYIHESNLAHRDLKPHNVLLSSDRQTSILTDYGSMTERTIELKDSRKCQEIAEWAAENCSMFYRAPELFEPRAGSSINEKADVWSLGCVLYSMLFNKGPFDYVLEKGDSIAMAVANANFKLNDSQKSQRPGYMIKLINDMIVTEGFRRESLNNVMGVIKNNSTFSTNSVSA